MSNPLPKQAAEVHCVHAFRHWTTAFATIESRRHQRITTVHRSSIKTRMRGHRRNGSDEQGAELLEFALVLPIFALLLCGMIDFGLIFGGFISLRNDVGAAARSAAVDYVPSSCTSATNQMLCTAESDIGSLPGVVPGSIEVAISFPNGSSSTVGDPVLVCAQATMRSSSGLTSPFISGRTFSASSETRLEQIPSYVAGSSVSGFTC